MKAFTLKIASYNIAAGRYNRDFSGITADIRTVNADIIGLQEVDQLVPRSGCVRQTETLASLCGYPYFHFVHAIDLDGGAYGTAILSRYPLTDFHVRPLSSPNVECRSIGGGLVTAGGCTFAFFNTHLSYENDAVRQIQFQEVARLLNAFPSYILTGDFNTDHYEQFSCLPHAQIENSDAHKYITFPPLLGIDNIVHTPDWEVGAVTVGPDGHSDHRLFAVTLQQKEAANTCLS